MTRLSCQNLSLQRGDAIIRPPDISLDAAQVVIVRGVSGCGKTSLLLCLAGYVRPSYGTVRAMDNDIYALPPFECRQWQKEQVGLLYAEPQFLKNLSVEDNIKLACHLSNAKFERDFLMHLCAQLGLEGYLGFMPLQLSRGQAQRMALLRALIKKPAILFADEPTSALDDVSALAVVACINDYVLAHKAVAVLTTHDTALNIDGAKKVQMGRHHEGQAT